MKGIVKEVDKLQFEFDQRQNSLMSSGLREDEAVILSKETQVQRVVRQCKESHGGPIHSLKELESLVVLKGKVDEIRYRKFTCLLKVATNNELFKQQGIENKERITHLSQLLSDDTKPKCHASMADIEAIYGMGVDEPESERPNLSKSPIDVSADCAEWLLNGCWPLKEQEHVVVLFDDSFLLAIVEKGLSDHAEVKFMKSVNVRGHPALSHWIMDSTAEVSNAPKDSILRVRPILEPKGSSRKTLKFCLENHEAINQFIQSQQS